MPFKGLSNVKDFIECKPDLEKPESLKSCVFQVMEDVKFFIAYYPLPAVSLLSTLLMTELIFLICIVLLSCMILTIIEALASH